MSWLDAARLNHRIGSGAGKSQLQRASLKLLLNRSRPALAGEFIRLAGRPRHESDPDRVFRQPGLAPTMPECESNGRVKLASILNEKAVRPAVGGHTPLVQLNRLTVWARFWRCLNAQGIQTNE
jgi:hypothetical protein